MLRWSRHPVSVLSPAWASEACWHRMIHISPFYSYFDFFPFSQLYSPDADWTLQAVFSFYDLAANEHAFLLVLNMGPHCLCAVSWWLRLTDSTTWGYQGQQVLFGLVWPWVMRPGGARWLARVHRRVRNSNGFPLMINFLWIPPGG